MIFKRTLLQKILRGEKTQTRRRGSRLYKVGHVYKVQRSRYSRGDIKILITRRYRQRLGDITSEEIHKEGYSTLEEFKQAWIDINGYWNPEEIVTVYEFRLLPEPGRSPLWREGPNEDDPMKQHKGG